MDVAWTLTPGPRGVQVQIDHEFDPGWPLVGGWPAERVIGEFFVGTIAGRTLRCVKATAEAAMAARERRCTDAAPRNRPATRGRGASSSPASAPSRRSAAGRRALARGAPGRPAAAAAHALRRQPVRSRVAAEVDDFDPLDCVDARGARRLDRYLAARPGGAPGARGRRARARRPWPSTRRRLRRAARWAALAFAEEQHVRFLADGHARGRADLALSVFGGARRSANVAHRVSGCAARTCRQRQLVRLGRDRDRRGVPT